MSESERKTDARPGLQRFKLSVQRNRFYFYTFACLVAFLMSWLGFIHVSFLFTATMWVVAASSAVLLYLVYRRWWRLNLDPAWFVLDSVLVTWAIYRSGGSHSPWFPWYVASISGAAVVGGLWWGLAMAVVDCASYLGLLVATGEVVFPSGEFAYHLGVMVSLLCAPVFFLMGTVELQKKRLRVKQLEEDDQRKLAELTRLTEALDRRTQELAEANVKVREADRLKSQFLANMSHELRTPLNSIIGFSEILLTSLEDRIPEKELHFLGNINSSGQHLLGIINDILDISKIEAGRMEMLPERFPLESVLSGVCTVMHGIADRRGIALNLDVPPDLPEIEADAVKVKQIFYNLLSNAVKYSQDNTSIDITARFLDAGASPLKEASVGVAVLDKGLGIDPQYHEAIFEEFKQLESGPGRSGGTGLGLALVKRLVGMHGGRITLESALGQGSAFTVVLPLRYAGAAAETSAPAIATPGASTVLVVEDDPTAYESIARELARVRLAPVRARSGEEALRLARELSPAAITLDIVLPGIDGWEVLKRLKEDAATRGIPVIIISLLDNREMGAALGADDYFLKPIDGPALIQRVQELIPAATPQEVRLLLIDDDPKLHELLDGVLAPCGYRVDHALSGQEGLSKAAAASYDLVILDLLMEGMDGFQVAGAMKAQPATAALPILVLTAKDMTLDEHKQLLGKVSALIQKGTTSPAALVGVIRDLVARSQKRS